MAKTLSLRRAEAALQKKKLRTTDEKLLAAAEKAVYEESAYSLGCERSEVVPYIMARMNTDEH